MWFSGSRYTLKFNFLYLELLVINVKSILMNLQGLFKLFLIIIHFDSKSTLAMNFDAFIIFLYLKAFLMVVCWYSLRKISSLKKSCIKFFLFAWRMFHIQVKRIQQSLVSLAFQGLEDSLWDSVSIKWKKFQLDNASTLLCFKEQKVLIVKKFLFSWAF